MIKSVEWANATYHLQEAREPMENLVELTRSPAMRAKLKEAQDLLEKAIDAVTAVLESDDVE